MAVSRFFIWMFLYIFQLHLHAINPAIFKQKLREPIPNWMLDQISQDLAPYQKELSKKFLDALFTHDDLYLVRVRVDKGILTVQKSKHAIEHSTPDQVIAQLEKLHQLASLPDLDFIFTSHDTLSPQINGLPMPIFVITKSKHCKEYILYPDWFALRGYEPEKALVLEGNEIYPWSSKTKLLFFRGKDTGVSDVSKWVSYPRPRLVVLSTKHPHLIDAKFSELFYMPMLETAKKKGWMGKYISMKKHPKYRYLMDIDGNCAATPRFPLLLHTNSLVFKSVTDSIQWFYGKIKPYQHFVPVAEDLSDLVAQIKWAKTHDRKCKKISENARQLADEVLSQESVHLYLYKLLEEYSRRQRDQYHLE
jgi:hypothetical protein